MFFFSRNKYVNDNKKRKEEEEGYEGNTNQHIYTLHKIERLLGTILSVVYKFSFVLD